MPPMPLVPPADDDKPPYPEAELRRMVRDTVREEQGVAAKKSCPTEQDIRKLEVDISNSKSGQGPAASRTAQAIARGESLPITAKMDKKQANVGERLKNATFR